MGIHGGGANRGRRNSQCKFLHGWIGVPLWSEESRGPWEKINGNPFNRVTAPHSTPIALRPSTCRPPTQTGDVDIFDDKISQPYPGAFAGGQKIAFGRRPSLRS